MRTNVNLLCMKDIQTAPGGLHVFQFPASMQIIMLNESVLVFRDVRSGE